MTRSIAVQPDHCSNEESSCRFAAVGIATAYAVPRWDPAPPSSNPSSPGYARDRRCERFWAGPPPRRLAGEHPHAARSASADQLVIPEPDQNQMPINAPTRARTGRIPEGAVDWIRQVFAAVNRQVSGTLSRIPTHHEPELDLQFIAALNQAPAVADVSGWTVYIQTHFLGGRRHFFNWEVADIGLLVIFRDRGKVLRIKTGLLQSKRLYPRESKQLPDQQRRFRIGFATLLEDPEAFRALAAGRTFTFDEESRYLALANGSQQAQVLANYSARTGIPVYYLLYNPVRLPWAAVVPATEVTVLPNVDVGLRVLPVDVVRELMEGKKESYHPSYRDVLAAPAPFSAPHRGGWSLEHFVADELVRCHQGHVAADSTDAALEELFFNRAGPISAAVAVTIEAPAGVEFELPQLNA